MAGKTKKKNYIFDFFVIEQGVKADLFSIDIVSYLMQIASENSEAQYTAHGCTREIYGLKYREDSRSFSGQIRKHRKAELPEIGSVGSVGKPMILGDDEGVIEKNFFTFHINNLLLIMHRNEQANSAIHFTQLITLSSGYKCISTPVINPEDARSILRNDIPVKKIKVKMHRPKNAGLYPPDAGSLESAILDVMSAAGADTIDICLGIDSKLPDSRPGLLKSVKSALSYLISAGATHATIDSDENGKIHPIDLIANRIYSVQTEKTNTSYPSDNDMYNLADKAFIEQREVIREYFGAENNRII